MYLCDNVLDRIAGRTVLNIGNASNTDDYCSDPRYAPKGVTFFYSVEWTR